MKYLFFGFFSPLLFFFCPRPSPLFPPPLGEGGFQKSSAQPGGGYVPLPVPVPGRGATSGRREPRPGRRGPAGPPGPAAASPPCARRPDTPHPPPAAMRRASAGGLRGAPPGAEGAAGLKRFRRAGKGGPGRGGAPFAARPSRSEAPRTSPGNFPRKRWPRALRSRGRSALRRCWAPWARRTALRTGASRRQPRERRCRRPSAARGEGPGLRMVNQVGRFGGCCPASASAYPVPQIPVTPSS